MKFQLVRNGKGKREVKGRALSKKEADELNERMKKAFPDDAAPISGCCDPVPKSEW